MRGTSGRIGPKLLISWGRRAALAEGRKTLDPARQVSWNQWDGRGWRAARRDRNVIYIMPVKGYFEGTIFAGFLAEGSLGQWVGSKSAGKNLLIIL